MKTATKKYPSCRNLGLPVYKGGHPPPNIAWVPADLVEKMLKESVPVFSAPEVVDGKKFYLTWTRMGLKEGEVMGFVLGPYKIPPMPEDAVMPEPLPQDEKILPGHLPDTPDDELTEEQKKAKAEILANMPKLTAEEMLEREKQIAEKAQGDKKVLGVGESPGGELHILPTSKGRIIDPNGGLVPKKDNSEN